MNDRRAAGEGTIEELPSKRFRVKVPNAAGGRDSLGTFKTWAEADSARKGALKLARDLGLATVGAVTFLAYAALRVDLRAKQGGRNARTERQNLKKHLGCAHFAAWPIKNIRRRDVRRFRDELIAKPAAPSPHHKNHETRPIARQTVLNVMSLLRTILGDAAEDEIIDANPAIGVKIPKRPKTTEGWTYLQLLEQGALTKVVQTDPEALVSLVAFGCGFREGEQWMLELEDVHVNGKNPYATVRFGGREKIGGRWVKQPPKNGKIRRVELFGVGLAAMKAWLLLLPKKGETLERGARLRGIPFKNPLGLAFPGVRGGYRAEHKPPKRFRAWLKMAGITRRVRWHDLRHTHGSALVSGMWGPAWTLPATQVQMGQSSITMTQRYAHLSPDAMKASASATTDPLLGSCGVEGSESTHSPRALPPAEESALIVVETSGFVNRRSGVQIPKAAPELASTVDRAWTAQKGRSRRGAIRRNILAAVEAAKAGDQEGTFAHMRFVLRAHPVWRGRVARAARGAR